MSETDTPIRNADPAELAKFGDAAHRWWDPESEFKPLHRINPLRLGWIDRVCGGVAGKAVLDVGCGGGTVDQILAAQKAQVSTLFDLSTKALASVEKIAELNLQASKASLSETASHAQALLGVKDVQELMTVQAAAVQPLAEKAASYSRHLYDIATGMGTELSKVAEAQASDAQKQFVAAVDSAVKNAPQGSESAVAAVKSAVSTASAAMESVQKAVKQATELAEANFNAVTSTAAAGAKPAARSSKSAA